MHYVIHPLCLRGGDGVDLIQQDLNHDELSEAVRHYSASKLYELVEKLEPFVDETVALLQSGDVASAQMIIASNSVVRSYLTALKDLGKLYQVDREPASQEEMIPASQLPMMIEAAVSKEVDIAVEAALAEHREDEARRKALRAADAKDLVAKALSRARSRA